MAEGPEAQESTPMTPFKRASHADAHWHFKFTHNGVRYTRSTDTADKDLARQVARAKQKAIIDALIRGSLDELENTKLRHTQAPTLAELKPLYIECTAAGVTASPATRKHNWHCLLNVMRSPRLASSEEKNHVARRSITDLPGAAKPWFSAAAVVAAQADQTTGARIKRTANSTYNQARAIFLPAALAWYSDPDHNPRSAVYRHFSDAMAQFHTNYHAYKFNRLPRKTYNPPGDDIVEKTIRDWSELTDRALFLAIGLELSFGLRLGEVRQARADWLTIRQGVPMLDTTNRSAEHCSAPVSVKNKTGAIQVRALDPFYTILRTRLSVLRPPSSGLLLESPGTIGNCVSAFLRAHGWRTIKTNHALRDYAGSQIYMKFGPHDAMTWLRHSNIQVTTDYYTGFVSTLKQLDRDAIAIDWATVTGHFTPKIVEA